jgi:hypothetical protein
MGIFGVRRESPLWLFDEVLHRGKGGNIGGGLFIFLDMRLGGVPRWLWGGAAFAQQGAFKAAIEIDALQSFVRAVEIFYRKAMDSQ